MMQAERVAAALTEDPHEGSPTAAWVDRLAAGAAAIGSALTGVFSWLVASAGGFDRVGRISPHIAVLALAFGALGIVTAIFGAFMRHRGTDDPARRGRTLWFGWAAIFMVVAFLIGAITAIATVRSRQQPDVSVKYVGGSVHADVSAGGLSDSQRLSVALLGYTTNGVRTLYQGQVGPKADGSVTVTIDVPVPAEAYRHAAVVAYTTQLRGFSVTDLFPAKPEPSAATDEPDAAGNPNEQLAADCWKPTGWIDYSLFACAEVELASGITAPRLTITTTGTGADRSATIKLTSTMLPWRSYVVTATDLMTASDASMGDVLYSGRVAPDAVGSVDSSVSLIIGSAERRLCVVAAPDWMEPNDSELKCATLPPIDEARTGASSVGWARIAIPAVEADPEK